MSPSLSGLLEIDKTTTMIKILSSCLGLLVCTDLMLLKVTARTKHTMDEYLDEDKITHMTKKQNYIRQRALEDDALKRDLGVAYAVESFQPDTNPEELPPLIVDYANMIRNDFILLDNSVQTRTRKRGINKVEKTSQVLLDPSCSCQYRKDTMVLGDDFFPPTIPITRCKRELCSPDYRCQMSNDTWTVLKKSDMSEKTAMRLPKDFEHAALEGWIAVSISVTVGCLCAADD